MNTFQRLVDAMFNITEAHVLLEYAKDGAVSLVAPYVKHLLWYYETDDEKEKKYALQALQSFANQIEKEINDMEGKPERRIQRVEIEMLQKVEFGERMFFKQYQERATLNNSKSKELVNKYLQGRVSLADLMLGVEIAPKKKIKLTVLLT